MCLRSRGFTDVGYIVSDFLRRAPCRLFWKIEFDCSRANTLENKWLHSPEKFIPLCEANRVTEEPQNRDVALGDTGEEEEEKAFRVTLDISSEDAASLEGIAVRWIDEWMRYAQTERSRSSVDAE